VQTPESSKRPRIALAKMLYKIGINCLTSEETQEAVKALNDALTFLHGKPLGQAEDGANNTLKYAIFDPVLLLEYIDTHNNLGIAWFQRKRYLLALEYLETAEKIYLDWKAHSDSKEYEMIAAAELEDLYTFTGYFLAQTYAQTEFKKKSALYSVKTLKRQYAMQKDYDPVEWSMNCAVLASFFCEVHMFAMAEHCLYSAKRVMPKGKSSREALANLYLLFAQFYKEKLAASKAYMAAYRKEHKDGDEISVYTLYPPEPVELGDQGAFEGTVLFEDIPLKNNYVIREVEEAIHIFKLSKRCFDFAAKYYILDGYVSDHIRILESISSIYYLLLFWEPKFIRRVAIQKRRIALTTPLLDLLNKQYYLDTLKMLQYEIGEAYGSIVEDYNEQTSKTATEINQMNNYALETASALQTFQEYFVDDKSKELSVSSENEPAYILSLFTVASVLYKVLPATRELRRKFLVLSLQEFRKIQKYVDTQEIEAEDMEKIKKEVELASEMCDMLKFKISSGQFDT